MKDTLTLIALLALTGASCAPTLAEQVQPAQPSQQVSQAEAEATRAATEAAQAAQVAAQAAQAAAKAAQEAVKEAESAAQSPGQVKSASDKQPDRTPGQATQFFIEQPQPRQAAQPGQASQKPPQADSNQSLTRTYRTVTPAELKALDSQPAPSPTQSVVNGADVGDFLGSGVQLDRRAMDAVVDREYNSLGRLSPLKPGEVAPSIDQDVENARLAEAKKLQPKRKGFNKLLHGAMNGVEDLGSMIGFPIGPDEDDARMDKFDGM